MSKKWLWVHKTYDQYLKDKKDYEEEFKEEYPHYYCGSYIRSPQKWDLNECPLAVGDKIGDNYIVNSILDDGIYIDLIVDHTFPDEF